MLTGDGDNVDGGTGESDWVNYRLATGSVNVDLAAGTGVVAFADGVDRIAEVISIIGSYFPDQLRGDEGDNVIIGFSGRTTSTAVPAWIGSAETAADDVLNGGEDKDIVEGQSGHDICSSGNLLTGEVERPQGPAAGAVMTRLGRAGTP